MDRKQTSKATSLQIQLDEIADDFLLRRREGEDPSIESYQQAHPELAQQIGDLLRTVQFVDSVGDESLDGQSSQSVDNDWAAMAHKEIGSYEILGKLGAGGMGTVFRARHRKLNRTVALKMLPASRMSNQDIARFEREMASAGQLSHPNIVIAYDAGEVNGQHFLAMELLDGHDLSRVSEACSPMAVGAACELIRQAAIGLQYAHIHGFVHRDIKPSNLMLTSSGVVKVLDLGLARSHQDNEQSEITNTGQLMGTINYMASEQCADSHSVDIRADIYSLGATLYRLLTGVAPFAGPDLNSTIQKLMAITTSDPPSVATHRYDLPAELVSVIDRAIRKDADQRFSEPEQFGKALEPFADATEVEAVLQRTNVLVKETAVQDTFIRDPAMVDTSRDSPGFPLRNRSIKANQPEDQHSRTRTKVLVALCLLIVAVPIAIASVLSLKTDNGTIVVDTGGVPVRVIFEDNKASFLDPADGRMVEVSIDKDRDLMVFNKDGFRSIGESFEIAFREKRIAVSFVPNEPRHDTEAISAQGSPDDIRTKTIRWAFENGLAEINDQPLTADSFQSNLPFIRQIGILGSEPGQVAKVLSKLLGVVQPQAVSILDGVPLDAAFGNELTKAKNIEKLAIYCPCEAKLFREIPLAFTKELPKLIILNKQYPASDALIEVIGDRCTKLHELTVDARAMSPKSIDRISRTRIRNLTFLCSNAELQSQLGVLENVNTLSIDNQDPTTSLDLSNLPPNIKTLWLSGQNLGNDEFKALDRYPKLSYVSLNGASFDSNAAKKFRRSHPSCRIGNYLVENSGDDFMPWAFANGLTELSYYSAGQAQPNAFTAAALANTKIDSIEQLIIQNTEHTVKILRGLNDLAPIEAIAIKGRRSFDDPLLRQLESLPQLSGLYVYCPHTPEQLTGLSASARQRITKLGFFCPVDESEVTNNILEKVLPAFPNVDDLGLLCTKVSETCLDSIVKRNVNRLVLDQPSNELLRGLDALVSVVDLQLSLKFADESATELRLPPNLVTFWFDGAFLDKRAFDAIEKCKSIRFLIPRNAKSLDREALKQFQAAKPLCAVDLDHIGL